MSHVGIDIDEISEQALTEELRLRERRRAMGVCDYCARPPGEPDCKFPSRHHDPRIKSNTPKVWKKTKDKSKYPKGGAYAARGQRRTPREPQATVGNPYRRG